MKVLCTIVRVQKYYVYDVDVPIDEIEKYIEECGGIGSEWEFIDEEDILTKYEKCEEDDEDNA